MLKLLKPWNVCNCVCMCVYIYIIFIYYLFKSFIRSSIKTRSHVWTHLSRVTHREWISPACLINVALVPSSFGHFSPFTLCVYLAKCLCAIVWAPANVLPGSDEYFWILHVTINQSSSRISPQFYIRIKPSNNFYCCLRLAPSHHRKTLCLPFTAIFYLHDSVTGIER